MKVIQDVCLKYTCDCTVRTATKPPQPIEKGMAGASLLAQVIVAKWADHQPLHRREKMFARHGIEISRKTMGGCMAQCAELLDPLYQVDEEGAVALQGDRHRRHQREGAGPKASLRQVRADLAVCRRRSPSSDRARLHAHAIARRPELQPEVLPKSPTGAAVRYALNQWKALTRFLEDGELKIDNGATERANRDIALGRGNRTFFGSNNGGRTAAVLRSFTASCKRWGVEPSAWFQDVLSRIPAHSITRLGELLPHNWKCIPSPVPA